MKAKEVVEENKKTLRRQLKTFEDDTFKDMSSSEEESFEDKKPQSEEKSLKPVPSSVKPPEMAPDDNVITQEARHCEEKEDNAKLSEDDTFKDMPSSEEESFDDKEAQSEEKSLEPLSSVKPPEIAPDDNVITQEARHCEEKEDNAKLSKDMPSSEGSKAKPMPSVEEPIKVMPREKHSKETTRSVEPDQPCSLKTPTVSGPQKDVVSENDKELSALMNKGCIKGTSGFTA